MGYYISIMHQKIRIPVAKHDRCLEAIKALGESGRSYSWVRTEEFVQADSLREALGAWRWPAVVSSDERTDGWVCRRMFSGEGDIEGLDFAGEKLGDDSELMHAIAPYVDPGSHIDISGEDGDHWRWCFDGRICVQQEGRIVYDGEGSLI